MINNQFEKSRHDSRVKKHLCPKCNEQLRAITVSSNINSKTSDKRQYSNPFGGTNTHSNMKSYSTEFQCPICRLRFKMEDLRKLEQNIKKN